MMNTFQTPEIGAEFEAYRDKSVGDAEEIIDKLLPAKILSLTQVFEKTRERRLRKEHLMKEDEIEAYIDKNLMVPVNHVVKDAIEILKVEIRDMLNELNTIRLWVRLSVPKMEDGNNFGVEVQEEVLSMLNSLYNSGVNFLKNLSSYYVKRAKLFTDMRKRPHIQQYAAAVLDLDDKHYINMVQSCCDLRNNYAFLYDKIMKNKEKILKPKGHSHATSVMY